MARVRLGQQARERRRPAWPARRKRAIVDRRRLQGQVVYGIPRRQGGRRCYRYRHRGQRRNAGPCSMPREADGRVRVPRRNRAPPPPAPAALPRRGAKYFMSPRRPGRVYKHAGRPPLRPRVAAGAARAPPQWPRAPLERQPRRPLGRRAAEAPRRRSPPGRGRGLHRAGMAARRARNPPRRARPPADRPRVPGFSPILPAVRRRLVRQRELSGRACPLKLDLREGRAV